MVRWRRFRYTPCDPIGEDGRKITGCRAHIALSRKAAAEGMVLLKNENELLPLKDGAKIALFGKASADYVKGGGGSGNTTVAYTHNLCDGMEEKQSEGKLRVYAPLNAFYRKNVAEQYEAEISPGFTTEPELPEEFLQGARRDAEIAVISICRFSRESHDREEKDDFYLTDAEKAMIGKVCKSFEKIVVVLNVGGMVDSTWFLNNPKISSVLLAWQAGMEGGCAEADILCGDVCPSGKLTDTFASRFSDYPSSANFNESISYVEYQDDIFVGYRYFETIPGAAEKVNFPFGFGLSYTNFEITLLGAEEKEDKIVLTASVMNTGKYAGKEVLQVYSSSPAGKLDKPARELRAFAKTDLLKPGESRTLILEFAIEDMASYDEESASYVLEKGDYAIYLGNSVRNVEKAYTYSLKNEVVTRKLKNFCVPKKLSRRLHADGSYEALPCGEYEIPCNTDGWPEKNGWTFDPILPDLRDHSFKADYRDRNPDGNYFSAVAEGKLGLEEFMAKLSDLDLIDLCGGKPNTCSANTGGMGDLPEADIPNMMTADGPAGLHFLETRELASTAFPCATLLACSWDPQLLYEIGQAGALEVLENNYGMWLTPGMNIHRSPLCGRNFEYYSEDPFLTGKMAAAMVNGIQSQHISACIKHFCCNNKEVNRKDSDSRVSERALREIYLKGFEIAVRESSPWALMTSYNYVNGTYASENKELLTGILRGEWGFDGLITTDWVNFAEHYRELIAGNNIHMPYGNSHRVLKALESGLIDRKVLEDNARRVLQLLLRFE